MAKCSGVWYCGGNAAACWQQPIIKSSLLLIFFSIWVYKPHPHSLSLCWSCFSLNWEKLKNVIFCCNHQYLQLTQFVCLLISFFLYSRFIIFSLVGELGSCFAMAGVLLSACLSCSYHCCFILFFFRLTELIKTNSFAKSFSRRVFSFFFLLLCLFFRYAKFIFSDQF